MQLPHFLVIGGMKCGSTTLYRDLLGHPDIYLHDKELNVLVREGVDARQYASHFVAAPVGAVCGDVSTTYSMLPDYSGVADRAARMLNGPTKVIYLVREPVDRAISHHRHMNAWHGSGKMGPDINTAVRSHQSIVNYSTVCDPVAAVAVRVWRHGDLGCYF